MADINFHVISGRVTKDIELKTTQSGKEVCSFSIAQNIGYGDSQHTKYWNIVCWGNQAKNVANNCRKGKDITVVGRLDIREYEYNGEKKTTEEIVALENGVKWIKDSTTESYNPISIAVDDNSPTISIDDEELPF